MNREDIIKELDKLDLKELEIELEGVEELLQETRHLLEVSNNRSIDKVIYNDYITLREKQRLINNKLKVNNYVY